MPNYRTPEARKRVKGTYRPDRAKRKPKAGNLSGVPPAPVHLSDMARAEWEALAPIAVAQGTLASADLRAFELLCETLATAAAAQATVAAEGLTINGAGTVRTHPAVKIQEGARAQATRLLIEFGLTPRARGHVDAVAAPDRANPFSELD